MLEALAEHWDGPMSLALFLSDSEARQFLHFTLHSPVISGRRNIGYHVIYKSQYSDVSTGSCDGCYGVYTIVTTGVIPCQLFTECCSKECQHRLCVSQ